MYIMAHCFRKQNIRSGKQEDKEEICQLFYVPLSFSCSQGK